MPILRNPKYEHFAQLVSSGMSKTEAAKTCGYSERRAAQQGYYLSKVRQIEERVKELTERAAAASTMQAAITDALSREDIVRELWMNGQLARDAKKYADSNQAILGAAKVLGLITDKYEGKITSVEQLGDEVLAALAEQLTPFRLPPPPEPDRAEIQ